MLTDKSKVCELHFEDDAIIKGEFLRHSNGSEEFIPKLRWKLKSDAITTLHLENGTCNDYEITLTTRNNLFSTKNYENASYFYRLYVTFQECAPSANKAKFSPFEDDALLMEDNTINVESPFKMRNWEAVADVDVVHDGPIPSQTIHLDFEPIYPGTHNEGFSQLFPTASYWEQSEPQISNCEDSRTSLETTYSDAMVDNTANLPIYFQNEVVDRLDNASLVFPSTWHR